MSWRSPEAWLDACGAAGVALGSPFVARGGEDELERTLEADPRRLAFLIGEPGQGTSRLALELARRAPWAWFPDPVAPTVPHRIADLTAALAEVPAHRRPVVVLDGPSRSEGFALARALLHTPLHPRLLVLVPATVEEATRLLRMAGYPRANARVAVLAGAPPDPRPLAVPADGALLPYLLAGRRPLDRCGAELARLRERRLVAVDPASGTTICLVPDRRRRALARAVIVESGDGAARLAGILAADPSLHPGAAVTLLPLLESAPASAIERLLLFDVSASAMVTLLEAVRDAGIAVPARLHAPLAARLTELDASGPRLARHAAGLLAATGDLDGAIARLRDAGLHEALTDLVQEPGVYARAAADHRDRGDTDGVARVLPGLIRLLQRHGDHAGANACCAELLELVAGRAELPVRTAAWSAAMDLAEDAGEIERAVGFAELLRAGFRSIGHHRGEVLALHRLAGLERARGDHGAAAGALGEALRLELAVDNPRGAGACRAALEGLAGGDPTDRRSGDRGASSTGDAGRAPATSAAAAPHNG